MSRSTVSIAIGSPRSRAAGDLDAVLKGIDAAREAGLAVKLNAVAQKGYIERDALSLIQFAQDRQLDISFIETMPLGEVKSSCADHYLPLAELRRLIEGRWKLVDIDASTGGPARYARIEETGGRIGFITALSDCFCEACNRLRLSATGALYTCLGHDDFTDLRAIVRREGGAVGLEDAIPRRRRGQAEIPRFRYQPRSRACIEEVHVGFGRVRFPGAQASLEAPAPDGSVRRARTDTDCL